MKRVKFITLSKRYKTIVEQLEAIPASHYKELCSGKEVVNTYIHITNCDVPLRTIVIKLLDTGKLIGILTNDTKTSEKELIIRYAKRWRIENLYKETNSFLHIDSLPGLTQSKIDAMTTLKMYAYSLANLLRRQLGGRYKSMELNTLFEQLFMTTATVQLVENQLIITFAHFKGQEIIAERFKNFNEKLVKRNIDPSIPWIFNSKLCFMFTNLDCLF